MDPEERHGGFGATKRGLVEKEENQNYVKESPKGGGGNVVKRTPRINRAGQPDACLLRFCQRIRVSSFVPVCLCPVAISTMTQRKQPWSATCTHDTTVHRRAAGLGADEVDLRFEIVPNAPNIARLHKRLRLLAYFRLCFSIYEKRMFVVSC